MNEIDEAPAEASRSPASLLQRPWARPALAGVLLLALVLGYLAIFSGGQADGAKEPAAATVTVARAGRSEFPIVLEAPGTVTPFNSVAVRPRVDGELLSVHFQEGDYVREGQLLARIDARPMRAALQQASAGLRRDQTRAANAAVQYRRAEALIEKGFVTKSALDAKRAEMEQAQAEAEASRSSVASAALQVEYSTITSPISGRVGFRLIDPGSMVSAAEGAPIVVVTQQEPIAVVFSLPQQDLSAVAGGLSRGLPVEIVDGRSGKALANGRVTTFDNAIDPESGTFQVKASFANTDRALWPGQFVDVRLTVDTVKAGIVIPAEAVQRGPQGEYVFVVDPKTAKAALRPVTVAHRADGRALIAKGLAAGETVVVDGQYGLRSGMKVRVAGKPAS